MKPSQSIALSALAAAWLVATPVQAETLGRTASTPGARLCTLSTPTTDTKVRPKATGFRNEGTSNAFVICAFDSQPGQTSVPRYAGTSDDPISVTLNFASIDGQSHDTTCTGVNSWPDAGSGLAAPMQYISKTLAVWGIQQGLQWNAADFGEATAIPASGNFSITCVLPPGVAILFGAIYGVEDVGS